VLIDLNRASTGPRCREGGGCRAHALRTWVPLDHGRGGMEPLALAPGALALPVRFR